MKGLFVMLSVTLLSGCYSANKEVSCGMSSLPENVHKILREGAKCPACLVEKVNVEVAACPSDEGLLSLGYYSAIRAKDYSAALGYFDRLVAEQLADGQAHAEAAFIYQAMENHEKAINSFEVALGNEGSIDLKFGLAQELMKVGKHSEAIRYLTEVLALADRNVPQTIVGATTIGDNAYYPEAALLVATAYMATGEVAMAMKTLEKLRTKYPDDLELRSKAEVIQTKGPGP